MASSAIRAPRGPAVARRARAARSARATDRRGARGDARANGRVLRPRIVRLLTDGAPEQLAHRRARVEAGVRVARDFEQVGWREGGEDFRRVVGLTQRCLLLIGEADEVGVL